MAIGALPVALEALAGIAELHIRAGMPEQAAAWLGLIQAHPSISTEVRNNVTARLDALRAQLQEESYSLLRAQAQEHTLETVVAEVLGSMGMLSI
jgi:hypothetical protein